MKKGKCLIVPGQAIRPILSMWKCDEKMQQSLEKDNVDIKSVICYDFLFKIKFVCAAKH
jgi:hypothetical protein